MQANSIFGFERPQRRIIPRVPAAGDAAACRQQFNPKLCDRVKILLYQLFICVIKSRLQGPEFRSGPPQIWPHLPALLVARCCGSRHLQSEWSVPVMPCAIRVGILCGQKKEHDAKIFHGTHLVVAVAFHQCLRPAATAQRNSGGAGGLFARRSALLPSGHRSGRFHRSGLPAAKSSQVVQGLRSGAEEPRTINPNSRIRSSSPQACCWPGPAAVGVREGANSIGFDIVFPYMGFAIHSHARPCRAMRSHCFQRM